jgi:GT2 family glycosyltransferase
VIDISIIIVNWNTKKFTLECIESIYKYINYSKEVIVVDNASSDGSVDAIKKSFPQVIIIQNSSNLGFAKANNIGIKHCSGKYIAFVNSDIKILENCFSELYDFSEKNFSVGIVGPKVLNLDLTYQFSARKIPSLWNNFIETLGIHNIFKRNKYLCGEFYCYDKITYNKEVELLSGCFWFVRKTILNKIGLFDENFYFYGEDKDFCTRFLKAGYKNIYLPKAEVIHYGGASSSKEVLHFNSHLLRAQLQYNTKYFNKFKCYLFLLLYFLKHFIRLALFISINFFFKLRNSKIIISKIEIHYSSIVWLYKNSMSIINNKQ